MADTSDVFVDHKSPSPRLNRIIFPLSWLSDQFFLTGFVFVYRDDLQIVAGRFQHERFVHFAR